MDGRTKNPSNTAEGHGSVTRWAELMLLTHRTRALTTWGGNNVSLWEKEVTTHLISDLWDAM